jgi:hypothetical protein
MFSRILTNLFSKHKTKILIILGLTAAIVVIAAVAKSKKAVPQNAETKTEANNE